MTIIGHLGKDAVLNQVNGKSVMNFSMAHSEKIKDAAGNLMDKTIWVDCSYWTDRTAIHPYLKKGVQIYAEGIPDIRTYTTQDGRSGATITLRILNVQLLGSNKENATGETGNAYNPAPVPTNTAPPQESPDDLPF